MRYFVRGVVSRLLGAGLARFYLVAWVCIVLPVHVYAEEPINRCVDSGQTASGSGGGDAYTPSSAKDSPSSVATTLNRSLGSVDLKTGGFVYEHEDVAIGAGAFPARLSLVRSYRSDLDGPDVVPLLPYKSSARQWLAYGRSGTHSLDIRFFGGQASFNHKGYPMLYIRRGLVTTSYQKCATGYKSSSQDGSRLSNDSTYGSGGYLLEDRDGTKFYFQAFSADCNPNPYLVTLAIKSCGFIRRIVAPNGDWLDFSYQVYQSHPSGDANFAHSAPWMMSTWATAQECHTNWQGAQDCRYTNSPFYLVRWDGSVGAHGNFAIPDVRLLTVVNSRGYALAFTYVDPSTTGLHLCTVSAGLEDCGGSGNEELGRNRVATITATYRPTQGNVVNLGQVQYTYKSRYQNTAAEYISTYTGVDGGTIRYDLSGANLKIYPPDSVVPATTVTFDRGPAGYYYPEIDQNKSPPATPVRTLKFYDRVRSQSFATGESFSYTPTMQGKWIEETYGTFEWRDVISQMQVVGPGASTTILTYFDSTGEHNAPVTIVNPLGQTTKQIYDVSGALISRVTPEGNIFNYSYDLRGNVLTRTEIPKPGSTLVPLVERWTYVGGATQEADGCTIQKICNRPLSYVNRIGSETNYEWDSLTGMISKESLPADFTGKRSTKLYLYNQISGISLSDTVTNLIEDGNYLISKFSYSTDGRLFNNGMAVTADGVTHQSCYSYDIAGNKIAETLPRANIANCP